jgi:hypothetical protein
MMMDLFGNVPIDTVAGSFVSQPQSPRATVAAFIESEVKASLPYLSSTVNATYGRDDKIRPPTPCWPSCT